MSDYKSKEPKYSPEDVLKARLKLEETVPNLASQFKGRMKSGFFEKINWSEEAVDLQGEFEKLLEEYKSLEELFGQLENLNAFKSRFEACQVFIAEEKEISNKSEKRKEFGLEVKKYIKETKKLSKEIRQEIKRVKDEKDRAEHRIERFESIKVGYPLILEQLNDMNDWFDDVKKEVPKEMLVALAERLEINKSKVKPLPEEISMDNMGTFEGVYSSITSTIKKAYALAKVAVDKYLEEQRQELANTQKEYENLLSLLKKQNYSVASLYNDIDEYVDMLDEVAIGLTKLLRKEDKVLGVYFGNKVDYWVDFNDKLQKETVKYLLDVANQALLIKKEIEKIYLEAESKLLNNKDSKEDLLKDIQVLGIATQANILKIEEIKIIERAVKDIEQEVDPILKKYYRKLDVGNERLGKESNIILKDSSNVNIVEFGGKTYMLIPKSNNVYGRITAKIGGKVDAFFEDAMLRGIIAGFGKGQSGVKMRDASTYEIKVRRTVLTANQVSGTLRIGNSNAPVANEAEDKFFVTFNNQFEAH